MVILGLSDIAMAALISDGAGKTAGERKKTYVIYIR